jgi:hypothetical protein
MSGEHRRSATWSGNHTHLSPNQIGGQCGQLIDLILRPAVFDSHVLTLGVTGFLQAVTKCAQKLWDNFGRSGVEEPDHRHPRRLRERRKRPREAYDDKCGELTPSHATPSDLRQSDQSRFARLSHAALKQLLPVDIPIVRQIRMREV